MRILITGGTGLIGRHLCQALSAAGHQLTVLSRRPAMVPSLCGPQVEALATLDEYGPERHWDAIINLAGEPIVDARWSARRRQVLRASRVALTAQLVERIRRAKSKPAVLLSGSAIGYYGDGGQACLDEGAPAGKDFGAQLCAEWEAAALAAAPLGLRVCFLRTGLVLAASGGILKKMRLPFSLGLGARLGSGKQGMSWIHIDDYVAIVLRLLDDAGAQGAYNMVAPQPVSNAEFTQALAGALHRPSFLAAPAWLLELALGEVSALLLGGQRASADRVQALPYTFQYPDLAAALRALFRATP
ncbi:MAG: TIGR01777 family protein [Burkholderiales bacterium]|nr:TIGR01777 family protein [Burkholderiales bacterium]